MFIYLQTTDVSNDDEEQVIIEPPKKKQCQPKKDEDADEILRRIKALEETNNDSVESLKEKVRGLALQTNPNESLLLLSLEELARVSRKKQHSEAAVFEELTRQAVKHQGDINISSLVLGVVGGKASDVVVKALSKCVKEKHVESKLHHVHVPQEKTNDQSLVPQSPLSNLYNSYMAPPVQYPSFYPMVNYGYDYRHRGNGFRRGSWRPKGNCFFCEMPGHTFKDCQKMKIAKEQRK